MTINHQVSSFISGLKEPIRANVQAAAPLTLTKVVGLAKLHEAKISSQKKLFFNAEPRCFSSAITAQQVMTSQVQTPATLPPVKRLTPEEMQLRRDKGLCFNCDEKFVPGHRCKRLFLIDLIEDKASSDEDEDEIGEADQYTPIPEISLHAMTGTHACTWNVDTKSNVILIDSGSTHNFLSIHVATQHKIIPNRREKFGVLVANGDKLDCQGSCKGVQLKLQDVLFSTDFYLLSLSDYDAILGAQRLAQLGNVH
ncbi:hypothetical protein Dimus_037987 [Dionaea muscipula]